MSETEAAHLRRVVEAVQALAGRIATTLAAGCPSCGPGDCDHVVGYHEGWQDALDAIRAALAPVASSGEAESGEWRATCERCGAHPGHVHAGPTSGAYLCPSCYAREAEGAESGDGRDPKPCPKCGQVCTYDGWGHVHPSGIGIGSCDGSGSIPVPSGEAESRTRSTCLVPVWDDGGIYRVRCSMGTKGVCAKHGPHQPHPHDGRPCDLMDDGYCSTHGVYAAPRADTPAPVPSEGQADGEGARLSADEIESLDLRFEAGGIEALFPEVERILTARLAARPVLSREALADELRAMRPSTDANRLGLSTKHRENEIGRIAYRRAINDVLDRLDILAGGEQYDPGCKVCGRDNRNGTHDALERTGHLSHTFIPVPAVPEGGKPRG